MKIDFLRTLKENWSANWHDLYFNIIISLTHFLYETGSLIYIASEYILYRREKPCIIRETNYEFF